MKEASVIFDGTARLGEALAVIVRYVQENFQPTQRLIRLDILAKALKGEELAQRLMSCLAVDYHFGPTAIIGGMRDGASVNGAALRQLMFFYPKLFDVVCFSHTIDDVVNATYYLEGDGPLIFTCYERLSAVTRAVAVGNYPNTTAVAREIAGGNAVLCNQLMAQAKACIQPGFQFYHQKFSVQFHGTVRAFKAARLCCPVQVQALNPTAASLEELRNFLFANDDATTANLAQELHIKLSVNKSLYQVPAITPKI